MENIATPVDADMCDNVRRAIKQIKENSWKEEENLARQSVNNLGIQINQTMLNMLINQMHVAEVYSPPPTCCRNGKCNGDAGRMGLDLAICDTD